MNETPGGEMGVWNERSWGLMVRDAATLQPEIFPRWVELDKSGKFFTDLYQRIYRGKGVIVEGNKSRIRRKGFWIEHVGMLAINDLGEMMVNRQVFEGNSSQGPTKLNQDDFDNLYAKLLAADWPLGWKLGGIIHSHPWDDVFNQIIIGHPELARAGGRVLTWSGKDLNTCLEMFDYSRFQSGTEIMINANHLSFMISTIKTVNVLKRLGENIESLFVENQSVVPRRKYEELGIVLYGGNYRDQNSGKILLERV